MKKFISSKLSPLDMRIKFLITLIFIFIILVILPVSALNLKSNLEIKEVTVDLVNNSAIIKFNFELDPVQKIRIFLFGAEPVKKELESIIIYSGDVIFEKVNIDEAVVLIELQKQEDTLFFPGIEFKIPAGHVSINLSGNNFEFYETYEIPRFYYT